MLVSVTMTVNLNIQAIPQTVNIKQSLKIIQHWGNPQELAKVAVATL
jgi:hypothetical protein